MKASKINWGPAIRRAKRQMRESRYIASLPKNERPAVKVSHKTYYRTQLPNNQVSQQQADTSNTGLTEQSSSGSAIAGMRNGLARTNSPALNRGTVNKVS